MALILIIVLVLILFGGIGGPSFGAPWQYGYGAGHYGVGLVGLIVIVLVILLVMGRL